MSLCRALSPVRMSAPAATMTAATRGTTIGTFRLGCRPRSSDQDRHRGAQVKARSSGGASEDCYIAGATGCRAVDHGWRDPEADRSPPAWHDRRHQTCHPELRGGGSSPHEHLPLPDVEETGKAGQLRRYRQPTVTSIGAALFSCHDGGLDSSHRYFWRPPLLTTQQGLL